MGGNVRYRHIAFIAFVLISLLFAPFVSADTAAAGPSTRPWAIRHEPGGNRVFVLEDSSIGVPIPKDYVNAVTSDGPIIATPDMNKIWVSFDAQPLEAFDQQQAGDSMLKAIKQAMGGSLVADTLKVEQDSHYPLQIRYAFNDCHRAKVVVLDRFKPIGQELLHVCIQMQESAAASADDVVARQDQLSDSLFAGAKIIERKPVVNHEEAQQTAALTATANKSNARSSDAGVKASPSGTTTTRKPVVVAGANSTLNASAGAVGAAEPAPTAAEQAALIKNQKAESILQAAEKLQTDGNDDQAYAKFKTVLIDYASTPSAAAARDAVAKYEADPAFQQRHKRPDPTPAEKAAALLSLADNYASLGKLDAAKAKYQQVLSDYPNTPSAATAKKKLADLAKQ
jgi:tetratricopeptide (TPR) repeat protein